jgi:hypothetical protein
MGGRVGARLPLPYQWLTAEWRERHPAREPESKLLERILAERRRRWEADEEARYAAAAKTPPKNRREKYAQPNPHSAAGALPARG